MWLCNTATSRRKQVATIPFDYASTYASCPIMALNVAIKHGGKSYDVVLDPTSPPSAFKQSIYEVTGIPVDRMKVMIKGGILKWVSSIL